MKNKTHSTAKMILKRKKTYMQSMMSSFLTLKVEIRSANAIVTNVNNEITPPNCVDIKTSTNNATTIDSPNTNAQNDKRDKRSVIIAAFILKLTFIYLALLETESIVLVQ